MTEYEESQAEKLDIEMERQLLRAWKKWMNDKGNINPTIDFTVGFKMAWSVRKNNG